MQRVLAVLLIVLPMAAFAAVEPAVSLLSSDVDLTERVGAARSHESRELQGTGDRLRVSYTAESPIDLFVFPLLHDGAPDTEAALVALLPAGVREEASLDLSVSPAWSPRVRRYRLHALSRETTPPVLYAPSIVRGSASLLSIAASQLLRPEPFQPSSYHRLRGYRVLGFAVSPLVALIAIGTASATVALWRRRGVDVFLMIFLTVLFLYGLRVAADLVSVSRAHLREWRVNGTYAQAGSSYAIADALQEREEGIRSVFVCHDGTSYLPTLLQYLLYPVPVTDTPEDATHAVVIQKVRWSEGPDTLQCGDMVLPARRLRSFSDGSVLYRVFSS